MGNIPSNHVRIWNELSRIENNNTRLSMLETLINGPEYVQSMKTMKIYADLMTWMSATRKGARANFPKIHSPEQPPQSNKIVKQPPAKRAMDYLNEAYDTLGLSDNESLTVESLKKAYKKAAILAHPDKGGSPEKFDAVTKAFLYLQDVYNKLIPKGARPDINAGPVTMEAAVKYRNDQNMPIFDESGVNLVVREELPKAAIRAYKEPEAGSRPVVINPKKIDMNIFNQLFEQNKIPDPEKDDGYGDWLKQQDGGNRNPTEMRGKFNIDVFNKTFDTEAHSARNTINDKTVTKFNHPDALILTPSAVLLGGEKPPEYTAPTGSRVQYTDLKAAYSTRTTFSQEVKDVKYDTKTFAQAKAEREKAPESVSPEEMQHIEMLRYNAELNERNRQLRISARDLDGEKAQERLKQRLLITQKPL